MSSLPYSPPMLSRQVNRNEAHPRALFLQRMGGHLADLCIARAEEDCRARGCNGRQV
jgi:hypothetical protein